MYTGGIDLGETGPFDLQSTLESGQSYLWWREDGNDYADERLSGSEDWYLTTLRPWEYRDDVDDSATRRSGTAFEPAVVRVRQRENVLEWESTVDAEATLHRRLRLDDDLEHIRSNSPDDDLVEQSFDAYWGMRLVRDPAFPSLVSFICSAQMRVSRIHGMQQSLREAFGTPVEFDGRTYHAYPTPEQLSTASEHRLRDLSLGYRAPYVRKTAQLVVDGTHPADARGLPYEEAREFLTRFVGVGDKVADCVLLFSLGYLQAVPLDTWIRKTIAEYYPDCERGSYAETSRAIRDRLGGEVAGYTQTYLFHYLRQRDG